MSVSATHPTRKSVPVDPHAQREIEQLKSTSAYRDALLRMTGVDALSVSEAVLLQTLLEAGLRAVRHEVEEVGYAQIAAETDFEETRRMARRRRPHWADEP